MKVCYFGAYDPAYTRVRMFIKGLRDRGIEVVECRAATHNQLVRSAVLFAKFLWTARDADLILVNEAGQVNAPIARLLGLLTRKPVILDAYLSKYLVAESERTGGWLHRRVLYAVDWAACRLVDRVLVDTPEHVDYFTSEFRVPPTRFDCIPIGADDEWFHPQLRSLHQEHAEFRVVYVGTFYQLHGAEYMVRAAALLRDEPGIRFDLYGSGPRADAAYRLIQELELTNVVMHGWVAPHTVPRIMAEADLSLGLFGPTAHARIVVPCKVFEALAIGCPVLAGDTPAMRRFLTHGRDVYLCPVADPEAMAAAIRTLRDDAALRRALAENGLRRYQETASRAIIGAKLAAVCQDVLSARARRRGRV